MKHSVCLISVALLLAACSSSAPPSAPNPPPSAKVDPTKREPTVLDDQFKALDKAKAVEAELQKQKEERDKQIEAAEQGK